MQDCKRWLRSHGISSAAETAYYTDSVQTLLNAESADAYKDQLIVFHRKWSQPFSEYFVDTYHPIIQHLEKWTWPDGLDSCTTNQSESFNNVLKGLHNWTEVPIDTLVLSLYRLSQFYTAEILRGRCGLGNYHLRIGLLTLDASTAPPPQLEPLHIIERLRNAAESANTSSDSLSSSSSVSVSASSTTSTVNGTASDNIEEDPVRITNLLLSSRERAVHVIETGQISLDTKLSIFTVNGTMEPRVVRLFPRKTCSCPSKGQCYHIIAAQMAIGIQDDQSTKRQLNLTQLRKNKRKKADKTSGRKRPRLGDLDVIPANDEDVNVSLRLDREIGLPPITELPSRPNIWEVLSNC